MVQSTCRSRRKSCQPSAFSIQLIDVGVEMLHARIFAPASLLMTLPEAVDLSLRIQNASYDACSDLSCVGISYHDHYWLCGNRTNYSGQFSASSRCHVDG